MSEHISLFKGAFDEPASGSESMEMYADQLEEQLMWITRMRTIALAAGEEITRKELIPYLSARCGEEKPLGDEVLTAIGEVLGGFEEFVGGAAYIPELLKPLDLLCQKDETTVREQAVRSIIKLCDKMSGDQVFVHLVPIVCNLFNKKDWFTPRVSACGLVATAYSACFKCQSSLTTKFQAAGGESETAGPSDFANKLIGMFKAACVDEPMVKRTAAAKLGEVATAFGEETTKEHLVELWKAMVTQPEQDSIRENALRHGSSAIFTAVGHLTQDGGAAAEKYLEVVGDASWRVRVAVAESLAGVAHAVKRKDPEKTLDSTKQSLERAGIAFLDLITDREAEVRNATAMQAAAIAMELPHIWVCNDLFPKVKELVQDEAVSNRVALAGVLLEMALPLGSMAYEVFLGGEQSLLDALTCDSNTNLRLQVISKLELLVDAVGIEKCVDGEGGFGKLLKELIEDKNWRVRHAAMLLLPALAAQMTATRFNEVFVSDTSAGFLIRGEDNCALVRKDWVNCCIRLANLPDFQGAWVEAKVLPMLIKFNESNNYQNKAVMVQAMMAEDACLCKLLQAHTPQIVESQLLPKVMEMLEHTVPNLVLQAVEALGVLCAQGVVEKAQIEEIKNKFEGFLGDAADMDVRKNAGAALEVL